MAFQAEQALFVTHQHARVRGAVRFVAGHAAFQPHRRMFEDKGSALIAVAPQASRLVAECCLSAVGGKARVGIVAVHARHCAFRQSVFVRPVEGRRLSQVAGRASRVNRRFGVLYKFRALRSMDRMAGCASHLVLGVAARDAPSAGILIQVAGEAAVVDFRGGELRWIADIIRGSRLSMLGARTVAGFAAFLLPGGPGASFNRKVRSLL